MQLPILVEQVVGNGFRAKSGGPLELCAEGTTRDEALQKLRILLHNQLQKGAELVPFEVPANVHPWILPTPIFDQNDPLVQEWLGIMAENRRTMEENSDVP